MAEESTTPDLVDLVQRSVEAANQHDLDALAGFWTPDGVWDMSSIGMGLYEGRAAVRSFLEDWWRTYGDWEMEAVEVVDLGNGVSFSVLVQRGSPPGASNFVQLRYAAISAWVGCLIERTTYHTDIDEGRAAAEQLAEERVDG
jgi:hypothetical protein